MNNTQPIRYQHTIEFYESNNDDTSGTVDLPSLHDAEQYLERRGWRKSQETWAKDRWEKLSANSRWQYAKIIPAQPTEALRSMF